MAKYAVGAQASGFISFKENISLRNDSKSVIIPEGMLCIGSNGKGYVIEQQIYSFSLPTDLDASSIYFILALKDTDGTAILSHIKSSQYTGDSNDQRAFAYFITNASSQIISSTLNYLNYTITRKDSGYEGYVGIGTKIPLSKLHIHDLVNGDYAAGSLRLGGITPTRGLLLTYYNTDNYTTIYHNPDYNDVGSLLKIGVNGNSNQLVLKGDGNVGIKTNNPEYDLDVDGDLRITGDLRVEGELLVNLAITGTTSNIFYLNVGNAPTDAEANGGGISLRGTTDKTILWNNSNDSWEFNQNINLGSYSITLGNIVLTTHNTYDIGSESVKLRNIYIKGNIVVGDTNTAIDLGTLSSTVGGHTTSIGTLTSDLGTLSSTVGGHTTSLGYFTFGTGKIGIGITPDYTLDIVGDLRVSTNVSVGGYITIANTGLRILDTNASHSLILSPGSNITANRTLTIITGDSDRSITFSGDLSIEAGSTINQDLSSDSTTAQFTTLGLTTGNITTGVFGAGTLLLPSITTSGDLNTGIWFPDADIIAVSTGGVERFRIASDGNITVANNFTVTGNLTVNGDVVAVNVATLDVEDKNILVNKGGTTAGSVGSGLNIEGDSAAVVGYIRINGTDNSLFEIKTPGNASVLTLDINSSKTITVAGALNIEGDSNINQDLSSDSTTAQFTTLGLTTGNITTGVFGAGLVATPSITTSGDLNTGIWFPDVDTIAISTGGVERFRIDSTGVITFSGTTSSTFSNTGLHILESSGTDDLIISSTGTLSADRTLSIDINDGNRTLTIEANSTINQDLTSDANVTFGTVNTITLTGGTNTFSISKGTASLDIAAGSTLDVNANLTVESTSTINQDLTTDATGVQFGTQTLSTSLTSPIIIGGTGTTSTLTLKATSGVGTTNSDIIFLVGNNGGKEAMRIMNSGKVGIGTPNPVGLLQVEGDAVNAHIRLRAINDTSKVAYIDFNNSSGKSLFIGIEGASGGSNLIPNLGASNSVIFTYDAQDLVFGTNLTERIRITSTGIVNFNSGSLTLGTSSSTNSTLTLNNSSNANNVIIQSGVTTTSYTLTLPVALDGAGSFLKDSAGNGTLSFSTIALDDLSDVTISNPVVDEFLRYNGSSWVNGIGATSSAGPGIEFFNATPVLIATSSENSFQVASLSKTPVTTTEQTVSGTATSNTVAFAAWLYNTALGRTTLDAGVWEFETYCAVSSTASGRVTTLTRAIYKVSPASSGTITVTGSGTSRTVTASTGTPFSTSNIDASATNTTASYLQTAKGLYQITARTSDTVVTITTPSAYVNESAVSYSVWKKLFGSTSNTITSTGTNYSLQTFPTVQSAFTVLTTDKLGAISFVTSNNTTTITLTYNGTARNTHFSTPLVTLHNNLAGLNGGSSNEYYHLTSAEYTGTGSGNFVRATSASLVTPDIGVATSTTIKNGLGLVGTPSYTFTGDLDTGIWSSGEDTFNISTAGVERMRITSGGNIESIQSVATDSGFNLKLSNTSTATHSMSRVSVYANNETVRGYLMADGLGTGWGLPCVVLNSIGAHPIIFGTSNTEQLRITSAGKLYGTALHNASHSGTGLDGTSTQYIASGTYTPTITNTAKSNSSATVTNITVSVAQFIRVGNVVHVSGHFTYDMGGTGIAAAQTCTFTISPPVASSFTTATQCIGVVTTNKMSEGGYVDTDSTNDAPQLVHITRQTSTYTPVIYYVFTYVVV